MHTIYGFARRFARHRLLQTWNRPLPENSPLNRAFLAGGGQDWDIFGNNIARELNDLNRRKFFSEPLCYVHGDLTAQNVLLDAQNRPLPIDFADSRYAPPFYELPPVLFDLFDFDPELIRLFSAVTAPVELADRAFFGILLHEFGASIAEIICKRFLHCEAVELKSIFFIRNFCAGISQNALTFRNIFSSCGLPSFFLHQIKAPLRLFYGAEPFGYRCEQGSPTPLPCLFAF